MLVRRHITDVRLRTPAVSWKKRAVPVACGGLLSIRRMGDAPFVCEGGVQRPYDADAPAASSSLKASIGTHEQNTCLSPYTLSTRATGGQYFTCFSEASGYAASSRG